MRNCCACRRNSSQSWDMICRTPLTSIICALRLLMENARNGLDSDNQEFLDICLRNGQRLDALIRDVFSARRKPAQ